MPDPAPCGGFRGEVDVEAFILAIAVKRARHHQRAAARRRRALDRLAIEDRSGRTDPEQDAYRRELSRHLEAALDRLPIAQREAFVLCEVEELSSPRACEIASVPEATIRTRLFHARRRLRELLGAERGRMRRLRLVRRERERVPRDDRAAGGGRRDARARAGARRTRGAPSQPIATGRRTARHRARDHAFRRGADRGGHPLARARCRPWSPTRLTKAVRARPWHDATGPDRPRASPPRTRRRRSIAWRASGSPTSAPTAITSSVTRPRPPWRPGTTTWPPIPTGRSRPRRATTARSASCACGRFVSAATALRPFATGRVAAYRRQEACLLLRWLAERDARVAPETRCAAGD